MRVLVCSLAVLLLAACGGATPTFPQDAGKIADASTLAGLDAGAGSRDDAAMAGRDAATGASDAGTSPAPDSGAPTCRLEEASKALKLTGYQQVYELVDLAAGDGVLGFAYSNQNARKLFVADASGSKLYDGVLSDLSGSAIPRALDLADGVFLVAGNFDPAGQTPYTILSFVDETGASKGTARADDFLTVAAARHAGGGLVIGLGRAVGADQPLFVNRYDLNGKPSGSFEIGRNARRRNEWDLSWDHVLDAGTACGLVAGAAGETLTLFDLVASGAAATAHASTERIAAASKADTATFGCRIATGPYGSAVALAEGDGSARLLWLAPDGSTRAGPVAFSTYKKAEKYDVAMAGGLTALAYLDDSTGSSHVALRVFSSPGEAPLELQAESGLNLGGFDTVGRRVRLAAVEGGFVVAFDANIKLGQTDLYLRKIVCE